jgi:gamma-glutamyl:cysteine ligase YbdK (ATP-grasp superfamily)
VQIVENLESFKKRFHFNPALAFRIGIERECFITDAKDTIVPDALRVISHVQKNGWRCRNAQSNTDPGNLLGYELSACQLETRTDPCNASEVMSALIIPDEGLKNTMAELELRPLYAEVAPDTIPLDVYPDPTERYARITSNMPREVLLAACQVAGTHVHIGMPDHETALKVYNRVTDSCESLCCSGDGSSGRRLEIYRVVAPSREPPVYADWSAFYLAAKRNGFETNPRDCWTLIRLTVHGTIEFRMFGSTDSLERIVHWAHECHRLCLQAAK